MPGIIKKIESLPRSNMVQLICKLFLGGIFFYAGLTKAANPGDFAEAIKNYRLIPGILVPIMAYTLPWLELILGAFLVLNIKPRLSAIALSSLITIFIIAIFISFIRGINIDCGCFIQKMTNPGLSNSDHLLLIIRDIFFLLPGIIIIFYGSQKINQKQEA